MKDKTESEHVRCTGFGKKIKNCLPTSSVPLLVPADRFSGAFNVLRRTEELYEMGRTRVIHAARFQPRIFQPGPSFRKSYGSTDKFYDSLLKRENGNAITDIVVL